MKPIPMSEWGKDHYSTLGYIECRVVDHNGYPDKRHMRCDPSAHLLLTHEGSSHGSPSPTRLAGGKTVAGHDDWSCVDDMEAAGLLENIGTGANPRFKLTDAGMMVCNALRNHKASGGSHGDFAYVAPELVPEG